MDRLITLFFHIAFYFWYRRRYSLGSGFRFNGYFIRFRGKGSIIAGEGCYVSYFSYLNVVEGTKLTLGDNVSIAHNVRIYTSGFDVKEFLSSGTKVDSNKDVIIGNNVLIGSNAFITPGTCIGDNCIVAANSVVKGMHGSNKIIR